MAKRCLLLKSKKDKNRLRENKVFFILQQDSLLLVITGVLKLYFIALY